MCELVCDLYFIVVLRMEILLSTEQEEKQLLKSELEKVQEAARREQAELRSEVDKVTEREGECDTDAFIHFTLV